MSAFENIPNPPAKSHMERILFETEVQYEPSHDTTSTGLSSNLSVGGLYLRTKRPLSVEDTLKLSFSLPSQDEAIPITCRARVAWINDEKERRKPDYAPGVGLQFFDISREDLSRLSKFVDTYDEAKKMNVVCAWCGNSLGTRKGPFGKTSHGICAQCCESLNA